MSIFTRSNVPQASSATATEKVVDGALPEQPANMAPPQAPPLSAPGVVPPPAAPVYSTRPVPASGGLSESPSSLAEKVAMARNQQQSVRERVRSRVQQAKLGIPSPATTTTSAVQVQPRQAPFARRIHSGRQPFDPVACAQTGLLTLAWRWQEAGAPIRAIHTYIELLTRYPDTPAASAAVADLVDLSEKLADQGQFHIALAIYDHLEYLA